jgi:hypothetical protein
VIINDAVHFVSTDLEADVPRKDLAFELEHHGHSISKMQFTEIAAHCTK